MDSLKSYVHWLIRATLAGIFLYHGLTKFPVAAMMAQGMGMPLAMIYMLATAEVMGGILILLGGLKSSWSSLSTRVASVIFAVVMVGAIALVHWPQWGFVATPAKPMGGMEFQALILMLSIYLFVRAEEV